MTENERRQNMASLPLALSSLSKVQDIKDMSCLRSEDFGKKCPFHRRGHKCKWVESDNIKPCYELGDIVVRTGRGKRGVDRLFSKK